MFGFHLEQNLKMHWLQALLIFLRTAATSLLSFLKSNLHIRWKIDESIGEEACTSLPVVFISRKWMNTWRCFSCYNGGNVCTNLPENSICYLNEHYYLAVNTDLVGLRRCTQWFGWLHSNIWYALTGKLYCKLHFDQLNNGTSLHRNVSTRLVRYECRKCGCVQMWTFSNRSPMSLF